LRLILATVLSLLTLPASADCLPPAQIADIKTYLRAADTYLTCLQQSDTSDTPPLTRKAHADEAAATYQAMQRAVDEYNGSESKQ
jgi:hypothetical protein